MLERGSSFAKSGINIEIVNKSNSLILNGCKQMVPYASMAQKIIVICKYKNSIAAAIISMNQTGVNHTYQSNHAKTSMYEVEFSDVQVDESMLIEDDDFWSLWELVSYKCQILMAAEAAGGSEKSLYLGRDYSLEREAFGQKIGSFQSIAHYLADGLVEVEANKLMTYQAAWAHDTDKETFQIYLLWQNYNPANLLEKFLQQRYKFLAAWVLRLRRILSFILDEPSIYKILYGTRDT